MDLLSSPSPRNDISDDKKKNTELYSNLTYSEELNICRYDRRHQDRRSKRHRSRQHYCSTIPPACKRDHSESGLKVLVRVNERFLKAVDYRFHRLINKAQRYDDEVV